MIWSLIKWNTYRQLGRNYSPYIAKLDNWTQIKSNNHFDLMFYHTYEMLVLSCVTYFLFWMKVKINFLNKRWSNFNVMWRFILGRTYLSCLSAKLLSEYKGRYHKRFTAVFFYLMHLSVTNTVNFLRLLR